MTKATYTYSHIRGVTKKKALRKLSFFIVLLFMVSTSSYVLFALKKPLPEPIFNKVPLSSQKEKIEITWPESGQAAIGSLEEGLLSQSSQDLKPVPMASITKAITALAIMKAKPFTSGNGETLTLTQQDVELYNRYVLAGGSNTKVTVGDQITQKDGLRAMLIPSSNNMADSMAVWGFGSIDAYISYANTMLKDLGLSQTNIADASGFSPSSKSTATELVTLGQKILQDPILREIVIETEAVIPSAGTIKNTNQLLQRSGAKGIKTGFTNEAGGCLLYAEEYRFDETNKVTIITAVLGASGQIASFVNTRELMSSAMRGFGVIEVVSSKTPVGTLTTAWGQSTSVITKDSLQTQGWKGTEYIPEVTYLKSSELEKQNAEVGVIQINTNNQSRLLTDKPITKPSIWWRLTHYLF